MNDEKSDQKDELNRSNSNNTDKNQSVEKLIQRSSSCMRNVMWFRVKN